MREPELQVEPFVVSFRKPERAQADKRPRNDRALPMDRTTIERMLKEAIHMIRSVPRREAEQSTLGSASDWGAWR